MYTSAGSLVSGRFPVFAIVCPKNRTPEARGDNTTAAYVRNWFSNTVEPLDSVYLSLKPTTPGVFGYAIRPAPALVRDAYVRGSPSRIADGLPGFVKLMTVSGSGTPSSSGARNGSTPSGRASARVAPYTACSGRSEEHTSELQSRENLVCRLLLEKKKKRS